MTGSLPGISAGIKFGQFANASTCKSTTPVRFEMVSLCGARFWIVTRTNFVAVGRWAVSLIVFGGRTSITARSFVPPVVTVTLKLHVLVVPAMAVQMTGVVPSPKVEPEAGVKSTLANPQLLLPVKAGKFTTVDVTPVATDRLMSLGQTRTGGDAMKTMTVARQESLPPRLSATVSVTRFVPIGNGPVGLRLKVSGSLSGSEEPLFTSAGEIVAWQSGPAGFVTV